MDIRPASTRRKHLARRIFGRHRAAAYRVYLQTRLVPRRLTVGWRSTPDFLIIGAQKCGTASLFAYLAEHPRVRGSLKKEVGYFNTYYHKGDNWYRSYFPMGRSGTPRERGYLCGEATPDYLFDPRVPGRVFSRLPQVKLITLVRDPVDRAYSHYRHNVRKGNESKSFEDALGYELEVLEPRLRAARDEAERERVVVEQRRWFYLARGRYHEQLQRWTALFPPSQLLVLRSEDLFEEPERTFARVVGFLGLEGSHSVLFEVHNFGASASRVRPGTEAWLREYYAPYNRALAEGLGWSDPWPDRLSTESLARAGERGR